MDPEDSIAVNGSGSIEEEPIVEAPIQEPADPVAPADEPAEPVTPTTEPTEDELFELPDGRKVDAVTLSKEWKENFYPEYTRKSQELAQAKGGTAPVTTPAPEPTDEWQPNSWAEVFQKAKEEIKADTIREQQEQETAQRTVEEAVVSQLSEIKTKDANVNENALFQHAMKYGFRDLRVAHQNMQDMSALAKNVQQTTAKNVAKRNDPVSGTSAPQGGVLNPTHFQSATDFLRALKQ